MKYHERSYRAHRALPREERFISGAHEFARGRKMNPSTQSVYDKVCQPVVVEPHFSNENSFDNMWVS